MMSCAGREQHNDDERDIIEILLKLQVRIRGEKDVELRRREREQPAVGNPGPADLGD